MKKTIVILFSLFALMLILSLSACGGKEEEEPQASPLPSATPSAAPAATPKASPTPKRATPSPRPTATPEPTEEPDPEPTEEPTPEPEEPDWEPDDPAGDDDDDGQVWVQPSGDDDPEPPAVNPGDYIGGDVNALYAACGSPNSSEYGPSCSGPGEDGVLYYDGFTVYTYREDGYEKVMDVG